VVFSASSLDGRRLRESRRILVIHLGDAVHDGTRFVDNQVEKLGTEPRFLVNPSAAELTLRVEGSASDIEIWALDLSGKRIRTIDFRHEGSRVAFTADAVREGEIGFLYEILRT
jgi:hypothetical protein